MAADLTGITETLRTLPQIADATPVDNPVAVNTTTDGDQTVPALVAR